MSVPGLKTESSRGGWAVDEAALANYIMIRFRIMFQIAVGVWVWYRGEGFSVEFLLPFMFYTLPKFCISFSS